MSKIIDKIKEITQPVIMNEGLSLVDIEFKSEEGRRILRFYVDKKGGVTLSECERISGKLAFHLDILNELDKHYCLEVSSPGLDRPLKTKSDFERVIGQKINAEAGGQTIGIVERVEENNLVIRLENGAEKILPFEEIKRAKIHIEL